MMFVLLTGCYSQEYSSELSSARDITGRWSGSASFQENVPGADCLFKGTFELDLQQQENNVEGQFRFTETGFEQKRQQSSNPIPPIGCSSPIDKVTTGQVEGTISSSGLTLNENGEKLFSGSFTSDILSLSLTNCLVQDEECSLAANTWTIQLIREN